jgi:hypothetical protein
MSSKNLVAPRPSVRLDRRTLVRGLAALAVPAIGAGLLADATFAVGKKTNKKRSRKKNGKSGVSANCNGGCR